MISNASEFSAEQQRRILAGISKNGELTGSFSVDAVIKKLRQTKKLNDIEFERALEECGLHKFMLDPAEPEV